MAAEADTLARLEALLFAAGDPLDEENIGTALDLSAEATREALDTLAGRYRQDPACGLELRRLEKRWLLSVKTDYNDTIATIFRGGQAPRLSRAAYETLAAVLYNQPVTRAQVEAVRGVNADAVMARLEDRGLIESCGVLEQPGRPTLYRATEECLFELGLRSAEDLEPTELLMYESIRRLEEGESDALYDRH